MVRTPKEIKEAFYTNHDGTTYKEVTSLVLCMPLFLIAGELVKSCILPSNDCSSRVWAEAFLEWLVTVLPQVLLYTGVLPPGLTCAALATLLGLLTVARLRQQVASHASGTRKARTGLPTGSSTASDATTGSSEASGSEAPGSVLREALGNIISQRHCRYISAYRGSLMLGTCICILAVDFRAFPRRYAKTHAWGTSLMDVGVGGVVLAGGLVSGGSGGWRRRYSNRSPLWSRLTRGLQSSGLCWLLWLLRLVSLRALDYQEAEGEYGVHWNFFATVGGVALLRHLVAVPPAQLPTLLLVVAVAHQALLSAGLGEWARQPQRDASSWLSLNKEGLSSVLGYWAVALAGSVLGRTLAEGLQGPCMEATRNLDQAVGGQGAGGTTRVWRVLKPLMAVMVRVRGAVWALWLLVWVLTVCVEPVSRRCANLTYIVWLCAMTLMVLLVLLCGQVLLPRGLRPVLAECASVRMLPLFLVANLLTGAVNLSMDTLQVSDSAARNILTAYTACLCWVLVALRKVSVRVPVIGKVI